jgi:peptide chain release factor 1
LGAGGVFSYEALDLTDGYASLMFSGPVAASVFLPEAGGHRVQRVPKNERHDRVHSSTVTIAVLPVKDQGGIEIRKQDLRIETYRSQGAGGQHRNVTDSAVRITHIPTGIQACSAEKSQHRNRELAMTVLRARLAQSARERIESRHNDQRRAQLGSGQRSDKVRTCAFQRGRVENHLTGKRISIERYLKGHVDEVQ